MSDIISWAGVVDTAVKIGLGAIIYSIASHASLKRTQKHEFEKERFKRRMDTLERVCHSLSQVTANSIHAVSILMLMKENQNPTPEMRQLIDEQWGLFKQHLNNMGKNIQEMLHAETSLRLLNMQTAVIAVSDCNNKLIAINGHFSPNKTVEEINSSLSPALNELQKSLHKVMEELAREYNLMRDSEG